MNDPDSKPHQPSPIKPQVTLPEPYRGESSSHSAFYWVVMIALIGTVIAATAVSLWDEESSDLFRALIDEMGGNAATQPESSPAPSLPAEAPDPRQRTGMRAEAEIIEPIQPPEDATAWIQIEKHPRFTTYRFTGGLSNNQILDIQSEPGKVWIGTDKGLLVYDLNFQTWDLFGEGTGVPGPRTGPIALAEGWVIADTHIYTGPHSVSSRGIHRFDPLTRRWELLMRGFTWDLYWDGENLWVGTAGGVEVRESSGELVDRFTRENSGLLHEDVHAVRRWGEDAWFAMIGDHQKEKGDFFGGGVSRLNLVTREWRSYSVEDGLARAYSCDLVVDNLEVWVAHWEEETGLSRLDLSTETWTSMSSSSNGVEVGGVVLESDGQTLWVGQQRGLVALDKVTRRAKLYREEDGLPGYIVSGISAGEDAIWVSAYSYGGDGVRSSGIVRIPKPTGERPPPRIRSDRGW